MSDHLRSICISTVVTIQLLPYRRPVSEKRTVSNYVLTVQEPPWDLGDLEHPDHPSFKLDPRGLVVPWEMTCFTFVSTWTPWSMRSIISR